ncbi:addiction module protein [Sorangium sp. So ce1504]|uniref:addiction module protein n=1 Tax=Sorangium sp. So ce1504 TaxID=3133337 RepID=UPI003F641C45
MNEEIEYVQALWERIAAREEEVPVPEWHSAVLDRRLAEYEAAPDVGRLLLRGEADQRAAVILAVLYQRRSPSVWKKRTRDQGGAG